MIRVLLVDDHASFRQPLAFMLDREPDLTVAAQAGTLAEARGFLDNLDLAVVDLDLPDGSGIDLIHTLRERNPYASALVLTGSVERGDIARAIEAGAAGVLHKSASLPEIMTAMRRIHSGEFLIPPAELVELMRLAGRMRAQEREQREAFDRLTPREWEVLRSLADGLNDREIAERLSISTETVRTHMVNILAKLGVESRLAALVYAVRQGAISIA